MNKSYGRDYTMILTYLVRFYSQSTLVLIREVMRDSDFSK